MHYIFLRDSTQIGKGDNIVNVVILWVQIPSVPPNFMNVSFNDRTLTCCRKLRFNSLRVQILLACSIMALHLSVKQEDVGSNPTKPANFLSVCSSVWSEFSVWIRGVAGSNPATQTNFKFR